MNEICLIKIEKKNTAIKYLFSVSESLKKYFTGKDFIIEYDENIEPVPDAVSAIPFVCSVLPIIWLTNSKLVITELDDAFYRSIPDIKKGYETMYPEACFGGELEVGRIVPNDNLVLPGKCAMFYSGGVDSMDTLYRHLGENPMLISIWGSDIKYDNYSGWQLVYSAIEEAALRYHLKDVVIHSSFREFDRESVLSRTFSEKLKDGWWHGVKHGIALLGHVAPIAYLHGLEKMYIASSNCAEDGHVRCASNPLIDNYVRYAGCKVFHDGFEFSRQDKVRNIVNFNQKQQDFLPLHVCWESPKGSNCCHCEKCYRTISAIITEGDDPKKYGFKDFEKTVKDMIPIVKKDRGLMIRQWTKIQKRLKDNKKALQKNPYWKYIHWIEKADFFNPETIQLPLTRRIKSAYGVRSKLSKFKFYQNLHEWKESRQ